LVSLDGAVGEILMRISTASALALLFLWGFAETTHAAPDCPGGPPQTRTLLRDQGTLESVIVGGRGRLFFTNDDSLLRLDRPGGSPHLLTKVTDPGGLAFERHKLIVGYGNSASNGSVGDDTGPSGLLRVNANTGAKQVYATGLSMANGLVRGPDGSFYASNDFGSNIDRVDNRKTERGWATVQSGNGLAIDRAGRYLFVAQTFRPAAIQRVDLSDPTKVTQYASDTDQPAAGLDGMTRDGADRLFVAANGAGEIWRVDRGGRFCALLRGLPPFPDGPSAVATGSPKGRFPTTSLYAVTFGGQVLELRDVAIPPRPIR
jgi:gluconolactonase